MSITRDPAPPCGSVHPIVDWRLRPLQPLVPLRIIAVLLALVGSPVVGAQPTAFQRAKAERLLREQLPCLGCHALRGDGGTLAPDLVTVRERRSAAYVAAIIDDPQRTAPGIAMPRTVMPPETRRAVVTYLQTLPGDGSSDARAALPRHNAGGAGLYARWCAGCHGASGKGDGPNATRLPVRPTAHADAAVMSRRPDDTIYDAIAGGGAIMNRSHRMPAFGATLTDDEIRTLVRYIRTVCGCQGPAWSRGQP